MGGGGRRENRRNQGRGASRVYPRPHCIALPPARPPAARPETDSDVVVGHEMRRMMMMVLHSLTARRRRRRMRIPDPGIARARHHVASAVWPNTAAGGAGKRDGRRVASSGSTQPVAGIARSPAIRVAFVRSERMWPNLQGQCLVGTEGGEKGGREGGREEGRKKGRVVSCECDRWCGAVRFVSPR